MFRRYEMFTVMLLCVLPCTVHSQEKADTLTYRYPGEVLVTAGRQAQQLLTLPFGASLVSREIFETMPRSVAFEETMVLVPGIKVDNQANGMRVHVSSRGQGILSERGIRGIRFLQDGIPFNDPTGFAPDLFDLRTESIERIEVLRGPAAAIYGGSASGGVVNVQLQEAPPRGFFGNLTAGTGSNGFWRGMLRAGGSTQAVNYWISASRTMGDGFRVHTHWRNTALYGRAAWRPSAGITVVPILEWTDTWHENPEGITLQQYREDETQANPDAVPYNEFLGTRRGTIGADLHMDAWNNDDIRATMFAKNMRFTEANNRTFNHRDITSPGLSLQYNQRSPLGTLLHNTLSFGADLQSQGIDEYRNDNIYGIEGDTVRSRETITQLGMGLYLLERLDIGERWSAQASLRYDYISNELEDQLKHPYDLSGNAQFSHVTGRVGLSFLATQGLALYANWGQGFLPPATEELAQNPEQFGGFNGNLVPALSSSVEVGTRGSIRAILQYDLSSFYLRSKNDFDRYRITDPMRDQETFYRNIEGSDRFGLELSLLSRPVTPLTLQAAYTWSDYRYRTATPIRIMMDDPSIEKYIQDGNQLPNSPQHQLVCDVEYRIVPRLSIGGRTETFSKSYIDGANIEAERVDGYTLVSLRSTWYFRISDIEGQASATLRNVGNVKYVAFSEPDPGGNAYQPGPRREAFVSLLIVM